MAKPGPPLDHESWLRQVVSVFEEKIAPNLKEGIEDPYRMFDTIQRQWFSKKQGTHARIPLLIMMLKHEASGSISTTKVAGGSGSASIKREFNIRKGLSKQKTYETFRDMCEIAVRLKDEYVEVDELYYYSNYHHWNEETDDGWCYTYPDVMEWCEEGKCIEAVSE